MDKLFLRQLAVPAIIGVHDYEKTKPQLIFIDLEAAIDANPAAVTDDIAATVDYSAIYRFLKEYIMQTRFELLETLAVKIVNCLIEKFSLTWVKLTITKKPKDMTDVEGAGVIIERHMLS